MRTEDPWPLIEVDPAVGGVIRLVQLDQLVQTLPIAVALTMSGHVAKDLGLARPRSCRPPSSGPGDRALRSEPPYNISARPCRPWPVPALEFRICRRELLFAQEQLTRQLVRPGIGGNPLLAEQADLELGDRSATTFAPPRESSGNRTPPGDWVRWHIPRSTFRPRSSPEETAESTRFRSGRNSCVSRLPGIGPRLVRVGRRIPTAGLSTAMAAGESGRPRP